MLPVRRRRCRQTPNQTSKAEAGACDSNFGICPQANRIRRHRENRGGLKESRRSGQTTNDRSKPKPGPIVFRFLAFPRQAIVGGALFREQTKIEVASGFSFCEIPEIAPPFRVTFPASLRIGC